MATITLVTVGADGWLVYLAVPAATFRRLAKYARWSAAVPVWSSPDGPALWLALPGVCIIGRG